MTACNVSDIVAGADLGFMQRRVSKDLLAALRVANNNRDMESIARIINNPRRGFGDAKIEQLLLRGWDYVEEVADHNPDIDTFLKLLKDMKGMGPEEALTLYLSKTGYVSTLKKDSDTYMLSAFKDMVCRFNSVEDLILASNFIEKDSGSGVSLITAHGSKGLEFDRVFVVGVEDGLWPHKNSEDVLEEGRLFYVAVTRAKKFLNLSYSKTRTFKNTSLPCLPSRLLSESYKYLTNS
jgi:DNA helicase-2/ATP-dependent DNA helicase PcrA